MSWMACIVLATAFTRPMERVATMDPAMGRSVYDAHATALVYEAPLAVDYKLRPYRIVPGCCELPTVSADGLTYVFRVTEKAVRAGLRAADVVRSLERLRDPELVSPNGWLMKDVGTIEAKDDRTVEIRLKGRCHFFPWLLTMPSTGVRLADGSGTGPYELKVWRKNHAMEFVRKVPDEGRFDIVRYLVVDDVSTQWLMFLKGEIDFLGDISRDNWDSIVRPDGTLSPELYKEGVRLHAIPSMDVMHIGINMKDRVLGGNRKLRQALNAAFDSAAWEEFYNHRVIPSTGPVPPGVEGRLESPFPYAFDLEKARRLMSEAGYADGVDPETGRRLVLTLAIGRASQASREQGELVASFFERIGIKLDLQFMTWDAFLKAVNDGRVQLYSMGWVGDYPDAQNFLQLFYSKNVSPGPNHSYYVNPEFDAIYDRALATEDAAERKACWAKCQEIIREDCPWIFTHYNKAYSLTRSTVGNYIPSDFSYGAEQYYQIYSSLPFVRQ